MKDTLALTSMDTCTLWHNHIAVFPSQPLPCSAVKRLLLSVAENKAPSGRACTMSMMTILIHMVCCVEVKGNARSNALDGKKLTKAHSCLRRSRHPPSLAAPAAR
jgi:hypothetical protein